MKTTPHLCELIYVSAASAPFSQAALRGLLTRARTNNRRLGVTGMLLHADGSFVQVLEGEGRVVDSLYDAISRDRRHCRVVRIFRTAVAERSFDQWTMGFVEADPEQRKALLGFNHFLDAAGGGSLDAGVSAKVRAFALQFRLGHWRQREVRA